MTRRGAASAGAALVCALVVFAAPAAASTTHDLRGTWSCCGAGGAGSQEFVITAMNMSSGSFSGEARYPGGSRFSPITGTANGNSVSLTTGPYDGSSYSATFTGAISGDSRTMSGSWESNANQSGTWTATRASSGGGGGGGGNTGDRRTGTQVICNYKVLTSQNICTATVGDGGDAPRSAPTGTVRFRGPTGGRFNPDNTCTLGQPSESAPTTATCSVEYLPPAGNNTFPQVTATYLGDSTHAGSSGSTRFGMAGGPINYDTPTPASGQFPNEMDLSLRIPADGTEVDACAVVAGTSSARSSDLGDTRSTIVRLTTQLKTASVGERERLWGELTEAVTKAGSEINREQADIDKLLRSPSRADQLRGQQKQEALDRLQNDIANTVKKMRGQCTGPRPRNASLVHVSAKRAPATTRVGYVHKRKLKKGKRKLSLDIDKRVVKRLADGRRRVKVYVHVLTVLPSGVLDAGLPAGVVKKVVFRRGR